MTLFIVFERWLEVEIVLYASNEKCQPHINMEAMPAGIIQKVIGKNEKKRSC